MLTPKRHMPFNTRGGCLGRKPTLRIAAMSTVESWVRHFESVVVGERRQTYPSNLITNTCHTTSTQVLRFRRSFKTSKVALELLRRYDVVRLAVPSSTAFVSFTLAPVCKRFGVVYIWCITRGRAGGRSHGSLPQVVGKYHISPTGHTALFVNALTIASRFLPRYLH